MVRVSLAECSSSLLLLRLLPSPPRCSLASPSSVARGWVDAGVSQCSGHCQGLKQVMPMAAALGYHAAHSSSSAFHGFMRMQVHVVIHGIWKSRSRVTFKLALVLASVRFVVTLRLH